HVAAGLRGARLEILHALEHLLRRAAARIPAIAEIDDALQGIAALTAQQDRRMRLLLGLRPRPDRIEAHELPVELGDVLGPDLLHRAHLLLEPLEARLELGAVVLHLLGVPAAAEAELEATMGEEIEAR